jgi:uncharacterized protein (TIGR02271 family)
MAEHHKDKDRQNESSTVVGHFPDRQTAELAARAALKGGFTVRLVDGSTVEVEISDGQQHTAEVEGILAAYGATNLAGARPLAADRVRVERGATVELVEEELQPHSEPVLAGEVLIRKHVVNETVTVEVPVQREELIIERLPIQPSASDQAEPHETDQLIQALSDRLRQMQPGEALRIPVVEEEVVIHKQPVVKSQLVIGKRLVREVQHFSDTVRREVADVDRRGDVRFADVEESS